MAQTGAHPSAQRKPELIWVVHSPSHGNKLQSAFEEDWICALLLEDNHRNDYIAVARYVVAGKPMIVSAKWDIIVCNHAVDYRRVIARRNENPQNRSNPYGVFLLSDENIRENCEWLEDPNCAFCVRNYVSPKYYDHPKVLTIGLGWQTGFTRSLLNPSTHSTKFMWTFSGTPHGERKQIPFVFRHIQPNFYRETRSFNSDDGQSVEDYASSLRDSHFAIVPPGQDSMDSFRMYEALEAGAIPVALKRTEHLPLQPSYWHYIFKGEKTMPFVMEDTWDECHTKMCEIISNGELESTKLRIRGFWRKHKEQWRREIKKKVALLNQSS